MDGPAFYTWSLSLPPSLPPSLSGRGRMGGASIATVDRRITESPSGAYAHERQDSASSRAARVMMGGGLGSCHSAGSLVVTRIAEHESVGDRVYGATAAPRRTAGLQLQPVHVCAGLQPRPVAVGEPCSLTPSQSTAL
jgi:hypothetical protein